MTFLRAAFIQGTQILCQKLVLPLENSKLVLFLICRWPLFQKLHSYLESRQFPVERWYFLHICYNLMMKLHTVVLFFFFHRTTQFFIIIIINFYLKTFLSLCIKGLLHFQKNEGGGDYEKRTQKRKYREKRKKRHDSQFTIFPNMDNKWILRILK